MDLLKKNIHMCRTRAQAVVQTTLEDDKNIPDNKPDVVNINLEKAKVVIDEIRPETDAVVIAGELRFVILYHTHETGSSLVSYEGAVPFEEKLIMNKVMPGDSVQVAGEVEDFSVSIINSRKLSLRCLVTFDACVEDLYDEELPIGVREDAEGGKALEYRRMPVELTQIAICKNDIFRVKEEVHLPASMPNILKILFRGVTLGDVEFKLMPEKLGIQGEAAVFLLYEGEGENHPVQVFETTVPFSGMLDCHGLKEGMLPDIKCAIGQQEIVVKPDSDGEERAVGLELALDIKIRIYEEETTEVLTDMYGVKKEVKTEKNPVKLYRVRACVTGKSKVTDHVKIPNQGMGVLQILHSEAKIAPEYQSAVEDGILLRGAVILKVLYVTGNDEDPYASAEAQIPYQYTIEVPGLMPDDLCRVESKAEQLQVTMLDGEEIDVKAVLSFNTIVFTPIVMEVIARAEVTEPDAMLRNTLPGMVIYVAKEGDDLWDVGRRYYVPVERIRQENDLKDDELKPGQKLLIVRNA